MQTQTFPVHVPNAQSPQSSGVPQLSRVTLHWLPHVMGAQQLLPLQTVCPGGQLLQVVGAPVQTLVTVLLHSPGAALQFVSVQHTPAVPGGGVVPAGGVPAMQVWPLAQPHSPAGRPPVEATKPPQPSESPVPHCPG